MEIIKWTLIGISVPIIGWLLMRTKRNARILSERIDEYHREQEELQKQSRGVINPYEQIAELFTEQENKDKGK